MGMSLYTVEAIGALMDALVAEVEADARRNELKRYMQTMDLVDVGAYVNAWADMHDVLAQVERQQTPQDTAEDRVARARQALSVVLARHTTPQEGGTDDARPHRSDNPADG